LALLTPFVKKGGIHSIKAAILKDLGYLKLTTPIEQVLRDYRKELDPLIISVNERIQNGDNPDVTLKHKKMQS
jgi:hypothetical protein